MAEEKGGEKKGGMMTQIVTSVAVALLVGGTSPWWFNAFTGKSAKKEPAENPPAQVQQAQPQPLPQDPHKEAPSTTSSGFFLGRWRVEQANGMGSGSNNIDYFKDGNYDGEEMDVIGTQGGRLHLSGRWKVEPLSDQIFRLDLEPSNGQPYSAKFKILDRNHIQNLDMNYVAERVQ